MSRLYVSADALAVCARQQLALTRAHPLYLIGGVLQPSILLLVMFFGRTHQTGEQVTALATAVLLMAYWGSTVWQGAGILRRERALGTLSAFMRGIRDPMLVLTGKSLGASLAPAVLAAATVAIVLAALRAPLSIASPGWFAAGLVAAIGSGTALGTLLCSLFLLTRYGPQLSSALLYPVFLLAGLLIPADLLPSAVSWLGWFISLRWAQAFLVSAVKGTPDFTALGLVALLTAVYGVAGVAAFRRIDRLARRWGTLELG